MKQCPRCGNQLNDNLNICTICGLKLNENLHKFNLPPPPPPNSLKIPSPIADPHNKISNKKIKNTGIPASKLKNFLMVSLIINILFLGIIIGYATGFDSGGLLNNQYSKEDEVLNRDRILYRKYDVILDWKGYSKETHKSWKYTIEWKLSSYIDSLRRDHSINYYDRDSVKKYVDCWEKDSFYFQNLHNSFPEDEEMANAILDIVHTLEYKLDPEVVEDVRYPDETLIEGCGDCEDLVMLCAAMFEGNGLDAIFIVWEEHAQAGVYLKNPPKTDSGTPWSVTYNNKKYYICESTGDYNWDVGDITVEQQNQSPVIIHDV